MTLRLGSQLGRYRIESVLGRGGMGIVYLATDLELERPVALKVLAPELAEDAGFRARFIREARLAAAIDHPAIVTVYDAAEIDGQLLLVMRYVRGEDLGRLLQREAPLEPARMLALLAQVADALDTAHGRGLVHRDVKPANILIQGEPPSERAYLADFGLTRRTAASQAMTRTGRLLGTIDGIAPEQIEGRQVDGRADQYSFACVLFNCLTGRPPFDAEHEAAILYAHVHEPPPRLSAVRPGLPMSLDDVIARAMSKDPEARYRSCGELIQAAGKVLHGLEPPALANVPVEVTDKPTVVAGSATIVAEAVRPRARTLVAPHRQVGAPVGSRALVPARPKRRRTLWWLVAGAGVVGVSVVALLVAGGVLRVFPPGATPTLLAFSPSPTPTAIPLATAALAGPSFDAPVTGQMVFVASDGDTSGIYLLSLDSMAVGRVTADDRGERNPVLSPDGRLILFDADVDGNRDLYVIGADGSGIRRITSDAAVDEQAVWSIEDPDDRRTPRVAFISLRTGERLIHVVDDPAAPEPEDSIRVLLGLGAQWVPAWEPDERILLVSDESGSREVWLFAPDGGFRPNQITSGGGSHNSPVWAPDGLSFAAIHKVAETREIAIIRLADAVALRTYAVAPDPSGLSWSPDGAFITFTHTSDSVRSLVILEVASGTTRTVSMPVLPSFPDWGAMPEA